jgi:hypothetical protein
MADQKLEHKKPIDPSIPLVVNCAEIEGFKDLVGRFVFKRPNNRDVLAISVNNAKKTEGVDLPIGFSNMAWVISTLEVVLTEKPEGLDFEDLYDMKPVYDLYDVYTKWENSFRPVVSRKQEEVGEK